MINFLFFFISLMICFLCSQLRWSFSLGITLSEAEVAIAHIKVRSCVLLMCSAGAKI